MLLAIGSERRRHDGVFLGGWLDEGFPKLQWLQPATSVVVTRRRQQSRLSDLVVPAHTKLAGGDGEADNSFSQTF